MSRSRPFNPQPHRTTEATLSRHFQAFTKDVDALMADYVQSFAMLAPSPVLAGASSDTAAASVA